MSRIWKAVAVLGMAIVLGVGVMGCSSGTQASGSAASDSASASSAAAESASAESASAEAAASESAAAASEEAVSAAGDAYVTVDWLKDNLDSVTVVDARSADDFATTHVKGAVNLPWQAISKMDVAPGEPGWAQISEPAEIFAVTTGLGIETGKPIVVYTDVKSGWGEDGRIMWELREAGYDDVKILDGGWRKWVGAKGEIEDGKITNVDPDASAAEVDPASIKDADPIEQVDEAFVKEHLDDAVIVDTRTTPEYEGELVFYEARMGRIPNAVSVPNVSLFNQDSTLKSQAEIDEILAGAGLTDKDALVITYCTGGVRGANVAEVLSDQGFTNVKVYTCGFAEWAGDKDATVEAEAEVPKDDKK